MKQDYVPPTLNAQAFNCPNCRVYTKHTWYYLQGSSQPDGYGYFRQDVNFRISSCTHCGETTIWHNGNIIFPDVAGAEPPNADLPPTIVDDYNEARSIVNRSPRGAAALLRLAIQKLCKELGQPGRKLGDDIAALVAQGLPVAVQQALDAVRVVGNEAVHPGEMDLRDDPATANTLFGLVNFIAEKMISEPKRIAELYGKLPEGKRAAIEKRDGRSQRN